MQDLFQPPGTRRGRTAWGGGNVARSGGHPVTVGFGPLAVVGAGRRGAPAPTEAGL